MAFNMKRPIIKGTKLHKASIAKAKTVVSQSRTKADASLVGAADALGKSYIPHAIDYSIDVDPSLFTPPKAGEKKGKKEKIKELPPKELKTLPTKEKELELRKSTGTVETKQSKDKFFEAAKKAGIDINNLEDYEKAERILVYDEEKGDWRERDENIIVEKPKIGDKKESVDVYQQKIDAGKNYGIMADDMISDGKGGYVPKEGAKSRYGDTWDSEAGGWRDDAKEQYYGPDGQKISKETADKLSDAQQIKVDKRIELEEKNKLIREKNDLIRAFKEEYPDKKVTQTALDAYKEELKTLEEISDLDLEEEDSPDWWEEEQQKRLEEKKLEEESYKPTVLDDEPGKPKVSDFKDKKNAWGGTETKMAQYNKAVKEYYKNKDNTSAMQMRDDKIWRFAKKGGIVHKNMRKGGYIPPNER